MRTLENKTCLVIGGTSGIGQSVAIGFGKAGANVVIAGRREAEGKKTVALVEAAGGKAVFVRADISKAEDVDVVIGAAVEKFGTLDIAFNNAGIGAAGMEPLAKLSEDEFDLIFDVNVRGLWLCMKAEIKQFLSQGHGGVIVNTSSIQGHISLGWSAHYTASKHAVEGYTKSAAVEYASKGIRVNAIAPGLVRTDMVKLDPETPLYKDIIRRYPARRIGETEDIVGAVIFLASDGARYINGVSLPIDGGYLTQ